MQKSSVVVVADKTSLKRPFIFANAIHMALCFFMLRMTVIWHRDLIQTGKMVPSISVAMMYVIEVGCLLLSVLGVFEPAKYAAGMAAASQTIIIRTALSYQDVYEKRVVREESKLLAMMPLTTPNKANRTLLHNIQEELECCGLIEGYKDWGTSIPASCNCHSPGKCVRLRGSATLGLRRTSMSIESPACRFTSELKLAFSLVMAIQFGSGVFWIILLGMSIKLMGQIKRKQEFIALLQSNRYVPGAF